MRLIDTKTLRIQEFLESYVPEYVILSHTWGDNEVSLQQFQGGMINDKITQFCSIASRDGFNYAWVDTCCIDKTSSAELSEAINSMYKWYKNAAICYAYLEDISLPDTFDNSQINISLLGSSRWFTRGWTLQELIAPNTVEFYAKYWTEIGTKLSLSEILYKITGIPKDVLINDRKAKDYNIAERMSWASTRSTTRREDEAYALLGIFGIQMPLLYGEGQNAFQRLQEEILKVKEDSSIFAWPLENDLISTGSIFARSPASFLPSTVKYRFTELVNISPDFCPGIDTCLSPPNMTSRGICITIPIFENKHYCYIEYLAAVCAFRENDSKKREGSNVVKLVCIALKQLNFQRSLFSRCRSTRVEKYLGQSSNVGTFTAKELKNFKYKTIHVPRHQEIEMMPISHLDFALSINLSSTTEYPFEISEAYRVSLLGKQVDMLSLPINASTIFEAGIGISGVLILACSKDADVIAVCFGQNTGGPWCEALSPESEYALEKFRSGSSDDQVNYGQLRRILHQALGIQSSGRTDRFHKELSTISTVGSYKLGISIRKSGRSMVDQGTAHTPGNLVLSITIK